jgi:hypothetical protein
MHIELITGNDVNATMALNGVVDTCFNKIHTER